MLKVGHGGRLRSCDGVSAPCPPPSPRRQRPLKHMLLCSACSLSPLHQRTYLIALLQPQLPALHNAGHHAIPARSTTDQLVTDCIADDDELRINQRLAARACCPRGTLVRCPPAPRQGHHQRCRRSLSSCVCIPSVLVAAQERWITWGATAAPVQLRAGNLTWSQLGQWRAVNT